MPPPPAATATEADANAARLAKAHAFVDQAERLLAAARHDRAVEIAREATGQAAEMAVAWDVLARALEGQGDFTGAVAAYGQAISRSADPREAAGIMARTALRLDDHILAEELFTTQLQRTPPTPDMIAGLARAQAGRVAFDQARDTLRTALEADAVQPALWLALGQILALEGRHTQAIVFLEEALRLDPDLAAAKSALAQSLLLGPGETERAADLGGETFVRGQLAAGRLAQGWATLAAAVEPGDAQAIEVRAAAPRWTPGDDLNGRLVLIGEEAIADELLLAHAIPSLIAEGLPLTLAVNAGWGNLARRSFPNAMVVPLLSRARAGKRQLAADLDSPHVHGNELVGAWAPLRAMMPTRRAALSDFAGMGAYLTPDEARIAHWRARLAEGGPGLKVGLAWRTPVIDGLRTWEAPLLSWLAGVLSAPGIKLVGLEWQEIFGEIEFIREAYGLGIETPPDLDRDDLDDVAALACASDLVIGPPDAATYLAAACGAETWFLAPPRHWALLGAASYPWFPNARLFQAAPCDDWAGAVTELSEALTERLGAG